MYINMYTCVHSWYTYAYLHDTHVNTNYIHKHAHLIHKEVNICMHVFACMQVIFIFNSMHIYMHVCTHVQNKYACTYTYTYTCAYLHTNNTCCHPAISSYGEESLLYMRISQMRGHPNFPVFRNYFPEHYVCCILCIINASVSYFRTNWVGQIFLPEILFLRNYTTEDMILENFQFLLDYLWLFLPSM